MPHDGLMDEKALGPEMGSLMRARLHIRGGKRRLRQGKIAAGIVTLYDALEGAMQWYMSSPERRGGLLIKDSDNLNDEKSVYSILHRSGRIDGSFDYEEFDLLVERALSEEIFDYDYSQVLKEFETLMTQLGVMPFDEQELPKEDPATY
ncbi:MAG: hypothetical protein ACLPX5_03795 [Dissulfurispiraceae bacterium]